MVEIDNVVIRKCSKAEVQKFVRFASQEGWNVGLNDADFLFRFDPDAYMIALDGDKIVGTVAAIRYDNDFGFIAYHNVRRDMRGRGIGRRLLNEALDRLGARTIGINCSAEQASLYEEFGFVAAHSVLQFEGINGITTLSFPDMVSPFMVPFDKLLDFNRKIFSYERKEFLNKWLSQPQSLSIAKYVNDEYRGYGMYRPCQKGYRIGPLICNKKETAEELLKCLLGHIPTGTKYYLDIPDKNEDALCLAEKMMMKKCGEFVRMYLPAVPVSSFENIFGFTVAEIG